MEKDVSWISTSSGRRRSRYLVELRILRVLTRLFNFQHEIPSYFSQNYKTLALHDYIVAHCGVLALYGMVNVVQYLRTFVSYFIVMPDKMLVYLRSR